jgi:uncharacterized protein
MEFLLGFAIAVLISITGVGAGSLIAPLLILFLHMPVAEAVGTALVYSAAVKIIVVPAQVWNRHIAWRTLGIMLATGIPGVVLGSLFFQRIAHNRSNNLWLYLALGLMIAVSSAWHIYRHFRPAKESARRADSPRWLALTMLPIGAEVGFSSSGAGALGTLALLGLTPLDTRRIVGTDLAFGLCLALAGGTLHLHSAGLNTALLLNLVTGGVLGGLLGIGLASRIPVRTMRLVLALWLFAMGVQLCWQALA